MEFTYVKSGINKVRRYALQKILESKLFKSFLLIFSGQGVCSVFGLISTIIIINGIGAEKNGVIIMAQTYSMMFYSFFSFKSFQGLIKYLTKSLKNSNMEEAKMYIKWSIVLDIFSLVIAIIFGFIFIDLFIKIMDWPNNVKVYLQMYILTLGIYIQGSTMGILRTFEKYNYVVAAQLIATLIKLIGFGFMFIIKADMLGYFVFEMIYVLIYNLLLIFYTAIVLKENDLLDFYKVKLRVDKSYFKFSFYSNITSTIDLPINYIAQFIINKYLGFTITTVYSVFEKLGVIINKLGEPISQIVYPEMNKLVNDKKYKEARKLSDRLEKGMTIIFIFVCIGVLLTYKYWFHIFFDDGYRNLFPFILYLAFISYTNGTSGLHSLFMAMGYIKYNLPILLVINIIYLLIIFVLIQLLGLTGVIIAYFIQAVLVVITKKLMMRFNNYAIKED